MRTFLKSASIFTFLLTVLFTGSSALASDNSDDFIIEYDKRDIIEITENAGVSENKPKDEDGRFGISTFGTNKPTNTHDINDGELEIKGSAQGSKLYTEKFFTGATTYYIKIKNNYAKDLEITLFENGSFANKGIHIISQYETLHWFPRNLDSSKKYYMTFSAPSNFEGSVDLN